MGAFIVAAYCCGFDVVFKWERCRILTGEMSEQERCLNA